MITSWKQTKTSFEGAIKEAGSGWKRRPKKKGPNGAQTADTDVIDIGCVFVQPAGNADSSFSDRNNPSSDSSKKKRRKQGGSGYADAASMDVEPVICLTSQHKVAVLGKTKDGNLVESKSRTYVTRPGAGSHFSLSSGASEAAHRATQPRDGSADLATPDARAAEHVHRRRETAQRGGIEPAEALRQPPRRLLGRAAARLAFAEAVAVLLPGEESSGCHSRCDRPDGGTIGVAM